MSRGKKKEDVKVVGQTIRQREERLDSRTKRDRQIGGVWRKVTDVGLPVVGSSRITFLKLSGFIRRFALTEFI